MEKLTQLFNDIAKLWEKYGAKYYLEGLKNTLILAVAATARIKVF